MADVNTVASMVFSNDDIMFDILLPLLTPEALCHCACVSRSWNRTIASERLWVTAYCQYFKDDRLVPQTTGYRESFKQRYGLILSLVPTLKAWATAAQAVPVREEEALTNELQSMAPWATHKLQMIVDDEDADLNFRKAAVHAMWLGRDEAMQTGLKQLKSASADTILEEGACIVAGVDARDVDYEWVTSELDRIASATLKVIDAEEGRAVAAASPAVAASSRTPSSGLDSRLSERPSHSTRQKLEAINVVLFQQEGFRGNVENYEDPRNSFIDVVLKRKLAIPISLSLIYICVARRVGVCLHGVNMPGHFMIRYVPTQSKPTQDNATAPAPTNSVETMPAAAGGVADDVAVAGAGGGVGGGTSIVDDRADDNELFVDAFHGGKIHTREEFCQVSAVMMRSPAIPPCPPMSLFARMFRNLIRMIEQSFSMQRLGLTPIQRSRLGHKLMSAISGLVTATAMDPEYSGEFDHLADEVKRFRRHGVSRLIMP